MNFTRSHLIKPVEIPMLMSREHYGRVREIAMKTETPMGIILDSIILTYINDVVKIISKMKAPKKRVTCRADRTRKFKTPGPREMFKCEMSSESRDGLDYYARIVDICPGGLIELFVDLAVKDGVQEFWTV